MSSPLKSKLISDYFEAQLDQLRVDEPVPFEMYLYFPLNNHVMQWKLSGDLISPEFVEKYKQRGLTLFWIHNDEREIFLEYLKPKPKSVPAVEVAPVEVVAEAAVAEVSPELPTASPVQTTAPQLVPEIATIAPEYKTEEGKKIAATLNSNLSDEKKAADVAPQAQSMIAAIAEAKDAGEQKKANEKAREVLEDVLRDQLAKPGSLLAEVWKLAKSEPEFEHGANVAMYATLIALAFGRIMPDLIHDLAFAGLLHDLGLSQFPHSVNVQPWKKMDEQTSRMYSQHVDNTLDLLQRYAPGISPRISKIIHQHHEKFNGAGYPRKLEGFKIDDISQLLAVADLIDSMCSGRWDGATRTLTESFNTLETLEKSAVFPEHFNPEIFATVVAWTRGAGGQAAVDQAMDYVKKQRKEILGEKK